MDIVTVGGGPAGLYFAIAVKKADPRHQVTVFERGAVDQAPGWGLVLSYETLERLRDADAEPHGEIVSLLERWDAIDVYYGGQRVRIGGHPFVAVSRRKLLAILAHRARALGVEVRPQDEVDDVAALAARADLLVGADGVRSRVRGALADAFQPDLDVRPARYIWLGTRQRFEMFTFAFERNEHGFFQAHAHRFDPDTSAFVVECDETSWRAAGLDRAGVDASLAYCEALFAPYLGGHRLLGNHAAWTQFVTVRNRAWHSGRVVLLGDAAHATHFSIGSGAKMAMEDAVALARALGAHRDVPAALAAYERERRPVVEGMQARAQESLQWFESVKRYGRLDPLTFTFGLHSRSKVVTYDKLRSRDPAFVDRVARGFAARAGTPVAEGAAPPPPMFTPLALRGLTLDNRVVTPPTALHAAQGGTPGDFHLVHLGSRALGGAGLVCTEMAAVAPEARVTLGSAGLYAPEHVAAWRRIVEFVHTHSRAKICLHLGHAGRRGATRVPSEGADEPLVAGAWPLLAASPLPYHPHSQLPRAMDREDMDRVREQFARAARLAVAAGFDMLAVHAAQGYLLAGFISPLTNVRGDAYGGSIEQRMRFPLEVVEAVRAVWPAPLPLAVRLSATDWLDGGLAEADLVCAARLLKARGCDLLDVSAGQTTPASRPPARGPMRRTFLSDMVRNEAQIATITSGDVMKADQLNTVLAAGFADLCAPVQPQLRDPFWTLRAADELGYRGLPWPPPHATARVSDGEQ